MKRFHILQHVPFEGPGLFLDWFQKNKIETSTTNLWEANQTFPEVHEFDGLVIMGGPMSVNDTHHDWLEKEENFVAKAIAANKKIIGICLGAQLLAKILGSKVYAGPEKEIGWHPIQFTSRISGELGVESTPTVFHWHGETFDLPEGAELIASTSVCRNQGFRKGKNIIGLQFHLEMTPAGVEALIANSEDELKTSRGSLVQTPSQMLGAVQHYQNCSGMLAKIMNQFL